MNVRTFFATVFWGVLAFFALVPPVLAQESPANDSFSNRVVITSFSNRLEVDNTFASRELGEPVPPQCDKTGKTVWWEFTAPTAGLLRVMAGGYSNAATWAIYEGDSFPELTLVAGDCTLPSWIQASSNHNYKIQVDSAYGKAGTLVLEMSFDPAPTNDAFAASVHLEGTNVTISGTLFGATVEPGEPNVPSDGTTVWYSWAAPFTGKAGLSGSLRTYSIYTGDTLEQLTPVRTLPHFLAIEGTIYQIQIAAISGPSTVGPFDLTVTLYGPLEAASNDNFANAAPLAGSSTGDTKGIVGATLEEGEPQHRNGAPSKSLWWHWQAPLTATANFNAAPSLTPEVVFDIYTGDALRALTLLASGTNIVKPNVLAGRSYYVCASVAEDAIGDVSFYTSQTGLPQPAEVIAGNLLGQPSFEGTGLQLTNWQAKPGFGGFVNQSGGADGRTWIQLQQNGRLSQTISTVAGRDYQLRFAFKGGNDLGISWDDQNLGSIAAGGVFWQWTNFTVSATQSTSTLMFTNHGSAMQIDGCSIVWLSEPPAITAQPLSHSAYVGGAVTFDVAASGSDPLHYQWFFNGEPLTNKTSASLFLGELAVAQAGLYSVLVTNKSGAVTSSPASLTVEAAIAPTLVLQPYGDSVVLGGYFAMSAAAIGTSPLSYQWFRDDVEVDGATNSRIVFPEVQSPDGGTYSLRVTNNSGAVWSLPAVLTTVTPQPGGAGSIFLANRFPQDGFTMTLPIFDTDNLTKLSGSNYVAQLYAGPTVESVRAAGSPRPFGSGFSAGIISGTTVRVPTVAPGNQAFAQVRVWESAKGTSYEEARARNGRFGKSALLTVTTGSDFQIPPNLVGLQSFHLQAGLPQFVAGVISIQPNTAEGTVVISLEGQAQSRYLIERTTNNFSWFPFTVLTNNTGSVSCEDALSSTGNVFYRARILD